MHRALVVGEAVEPGLLHGEAEHGSKPCGQREEKSVEHRQRCAARRRVVRIAIERVLADVEIEGREIVDAEIQQSMEAPLEVELRIAGAHGIFELGEPSEHVALELGHLGIRHGKSGSIMGEIAEQIAERIPELAVGFDIGLDDVGTDAQVLGIVGAHGPQPQDLRTRLADHVLRRHHIAERLRHLAPVLVEHEAVRHDRVVRGAAARAARLRAARTGTSRDAGPSLPDRARPARRGLCASPARRRASSRSRTRHRECRRPSRSRWGWRQARSGSARARPP